VLQCVAACCGVLQCARQLEAFLRTTPDISFSPLNKTNDSFAKEPYKTEQKCTRRGLWKKEPRHFDCKEVSALLRMDPSISSSLLDKVNDSFALQNRASQNRANMHTKGLVQKGL